MPQRVSLINILSNYACRVGQRGARRLYFHCSGLVVTFALAAGAFVAALSVVAFVLLVLAGGSLPKGFMGGLMGISVTVWSAALASGRWRKHGHFELDADQRVLRRYRAGQVVEFGLDDITRVWTVLDPTDGLRLNAPPSWLQVGLRSGEIFRLAKGSLSELAPVREAIRQLGVNPAPKTTH